MEKKKLFGNGSESEDDLNIQFNQDYAKSYNKFRQKEFIKKLKDQNSDSSLDSEESDSTDDEETVDPKFDKDFFETLSSLKSKDPKIYDKSTKFFEELNDEEDFKSNTKTKKTKPFTLKDYERKVVLEQDGIFEDDEESKVERSQSPSYAEEQRKIQTELKKILSESDDEDFGSIFKRRVKSTEEKNKEDEEYVKWLAGQNEEVEESTKKSLKPLKQFWSDPKLPKEDKFLRDYVLNKGYVDTEVHEIPTYEEIVGNTNLSEDEKDLEEQAEFEHKYNFRYEEPDHEFIKRYPRTIESSVRISDDSRKRKRQEAKERKLREKEQKMKELEMLKEIKRQEIEEKINKLKEVTGNDELQFKEDELESEFDGDAHDKRMQEIFNEEYYKVDEGEEKPNCPDFDELKIEDWDNFDPNQDQIENENKSELHCVDDDFNMDCDYDPNSKEKIQNEMIENTRGRRKNRRRNKFMEMIKKEKPIFDPEDEKTYAEYIDEYYKMNCEDFIGDLPCRFKYVECEPNDFGLTVEEILLAKNKELNQWASLKKAVQIRPSHVDKKERRLYQMKSQNEGLKRKIFKSLYGEQSDEESDGEKQLKSNQEDKKVDHVQSGTSTENKKKRKKKKKSKLNKSGVPNDTLTNKANVNEISMNISQSNTNKQPSTNEDNILNDKKNSEIKVKNNVTTAKQNKETKRNKSLEKIQDNEPNESKIDSFVNLKFSEDKGKKIDKNNKKDGVSKKSQNIKKTHFKHNKIDDDKKISDERLKAYGINPKKFHKKINFNSKNKNVKKKK